MAAMARGHAAVMVPGSHIPADRNGLKFYIPSGEIAKPDETALLEALKTGGAPDAPEGPLEQDPDCAARYVARYVDGFGAQALSGLRIGVYEHSSVARDSLGDEMRDKLAKKLADPALYEDAKTGELEVWNKKYAEVMEALDRAESLKVKSPWCSKTIPSILCQSMSLVDS